jgi:hypothetical protein
LGAKLDAVGQRVEKVELKVDNLGNSYVPHDIFELRLKELEARLLIIQLDIKKLATSAGLKTWVIGIFSTVAGSVITLLFVYYITHIGK